MDFVILEHTSTYLVAPAAEAVGGPRRAVGVAVVTGAAAAIALARLVAVTCNLEPGLNDLPAVVVGRVAEPQVRVLNLGVHGPVVDSRGVPIVGVPDSEIMSFILCQLVRKVLEDLRHQSPHCGAHHEVPVLVGPSRVTKSVVPAPKDVAYLMGEDVVLAGGRSPPNGVASRPDVPHLAAGVGCLRAGHENGDVGGVERLLDTTWETTFTGKPHLVVVNLPLSLRRSFSLCCDRLASPMPIGWMQKAMNLTGIWLFLIASLARSMRLRMFCSGWVNRDLRKDRVG